MDIFYSDIIDNSKVELSSSESHHCLIVLRKDIGDDIEVLDGKGSRYICKIIDNSNKKVVARILNKIFYANKQSAIHLVIAPTKSHVRIEWFVEKSIEIGVSRISFIKTDRTLRKKINIDRINRIAISAMKQSGQFYLPIVNNLDSFNNVISRVSEEQRFIAHLEDEKREKISDIYDRSNDCCIMIGPEGDFSDQELDMMNKEGVAYFKMGNRRLRSETAALNSIAVLNELLG